MKTTGFNPADFRLFQSYIGNIIFFLTFPSRNIIFLQFSFPNVHLYFSAGVQVIGSLLFLTTGTDKLQEWAKVENQKVAEKEITKEESVYNTDNIIPNNSADYNVPQEFTKDNGDTITSQESGYFTATQNTLHNLSNIILANDGEINKTFTGEDVESQVCVQDLFENVDSTEQPAVTHANAPNIDSSEQINADHSNISNVPNETSKIFEVTEIIEDEKFDNVNKKDFIEIILTDSNDREKSI